MTLSSLSSMIGEAFQGDPGLLFNSLQYLVFLPTVFLLFWLLPHRARVPLLLVASYVFYMTWRPIYGLLILGLTVANWLLVNRIEKSVDKKKVWVGVTVAVNLITL